MCDILVDCNILRKWIIANCDQEFCVPPHAP